MATRTRTKKTGTRTAPAKTADKVSVESKAEFSPNRVLTIHVGTCGDYGKAKCGLSLSQSIKDDADVGEIADATFEALSDKLLEQSDALLEKLGIDEEVEEEEVIDEEEEDEGEEEEGEDADEWEEDEGEEEEDADEEEEGDEGDYTEDEIMAMKKAELVALNKEEDLGVDIKGLKLAELREAICDAYFGEEEEGEDEEGDADEWEDEEWEDDDDA